VPRVSQYDSEIIFRLYKSGKTTREIAQIVNGSKTAVGEIIKKKGIARSKAIRSHILEARANVGPKIQGDFRNYLDGLMISDGSLVKPSKYTKTSMYVQSCVCKDWLDAIKKSFDEFGFSSSLSPEKRKPRCFVFRTLNYDSFYPEYQRWYAGEKSVPRDIDFSSRLFLKNWIYGDGTFGRDLRLCTDSFSQDDLDYIKFQLLILGWKFNQVYMGQSKLGKPKYRLSLCKKNGLIEFFKYVGQPDILAFDYKWPRRAEPCL